MFTLIRRIYEYLTQVDNVIDQNINITIGDASKITQTRQGVFVDGRLIYKNKNNVNLTINVLSNTDSVQVYTGDVNVSGSVGGNVVSSSGDINVHLYVNGNVSTSSGDVHCSIVRGGCRTNSGDINVAT